MIPQKPAFLLLIFVLISASAVAQPDFPTKSDNLYNGIEFRMPRVKEPVIPANSVTITDFGAQGGGQELCTSAFAQAIDAVSKKGGGKVIVPRGTWLTGPITLKSNIEIYTEKGALVVFNLTTKAEFEKIKDFLRPVMISLISCKKVLIDGPTFQNSPAWNICDVNFVSFILKLIKNGRS